MQNKFLKEFVPIINDLSLATLDDLLFFYSQNCKFSDPFHSIVGKKNISQLYFLMFKNLYNPKFVVIKTITSQSEVVIKWVFSFRKNIKSKETIITGSSWLSLNNEGLIDTHEDFWDGSEFFAAYFPLNVPINWAKSKIREKI